MRLKNLLTLIKGRPRFIALFIFLLAFIIRLLFIVALGAEQRVYDSMNDQYIYIDLAKSLVAGRGLSLSFPIFVADANEPTSIQPPLYPLVLSAFFYLFGDNYLPPRIFQALLSAGISVFTYLIGRKVLDDSTAVLAALMTCVYPLLVMYTRPLMSDMLYTFFIVLVTLFLVKFSFETFRPIHYIAWGAFFALGFLVRPEILVYGLLVIPFAVAWNFKRPALSFHHMTPGIILAVLAFAVTITPWAIRNWYVHGNPVIFPSKRWGAWEESWLQYTRDNSPEWETGCNGLDPLNCIVPDWQNLSELERDRYVGSIASEFVFSHPDLFIKYSISRFLKSYPVIPREELPPPLGYKGVRDRPVDGYHFTSLDDFPVYVTPVEKFRLWIFRFILLLGVVGGGIALKRQAWRLIPLGVPIFFSLATSFMLTGGERFRFPVDFAWILLASYGLISVVVYFRVGLSYKSLIPKA